MFLYQISGGRIAGRLGKAPIMILTTKGSKSGKQRTSPVLYLVDGENLVTVASAGSAEKNPAWFANLMYNPEASVKNQAGDENDTREESFSSGEGKAMASPHLNVPEICRIRQEDKAGNPSCHT
jgi:deazaflavin-dependent oxidoreductase (nitroreductase family)